MIAGENSVKAVGTLNSLTAAVQALVVDTNEANAISNVFNKLTNVTSQTTKKTVSLPKATEIVDITYSSANPKVCTIKGSTINKKSNGQCEVKVVAEDSDGNSFEATKVILFKKS